MTRLFPLTLLLATLFLAACANVDDAPIAETTAVDESADATDAAFIGTAVPFDTTTSTVAWQAAKVTRTHDGGFHDFNGALYLDGDTVTGAEILLAAASIFSDEDRLTGHLKSEDFFEVEAYPEASFRTTAIEPLTAEDSTEWAEATHRVTGTLTIRGQSNTITFPAKVAVNPETVSAEASFIIDRQNWGLSYPGAPDDLIRDEVQIRFDIVAPRTSAAPDAPES